MRTTCLFAALSLSVAFTAVPKIGHRANDLRQVCLDAKPNSNKPPPSGGSKDNWVDRIVPLDMDNDKEDTIRRLGSIEEYNVGIDGVTFQTGSLSQRMFEAMMSRQDQDLMSEDVQRQFQVLAMDLTSKEATKLAMKQNGFETKEDDLLDSVDSIQLLDQSGRPIGPLRDSWDKAVDAWTPGQSFSFIARGVRAKLREIVLQEVLEALDPDGSLREQASDKGMALPTEELQSLEDLANDVVRRRDSSPREVTTEETAFKGTSNRGYSVISRSDLLIESTNTDGTETQKTLMHVMDALVSHGCLLVDLSDGGRDFTLPRKLARMWKTAQVLFDELDSEPAKEKMIPRLVAIEASPHAKLGYANFQNGMKFLETRVDRATGKVLPDEATSIVGAESLEDVREAYEIITNVGKDVVRIATAASSIEYEGFVGPSEDAPSLSGISFLTEDDLSDDGGETASIKASQCAALMVEELLDDGAEIQGFSDQGSVSMSPHRLCQYGNPSDDAPMEMFGAHTDTSFVTLVPVSAESGLEVYDEAAEKWYRPELKARATWVEEREKAGEDAASLEDVVSDGVTIPWHARYIAVVPGEFLQIVSRQEIVAAVHRVVAGGPVRLSAPVLVRGRPGVPCNVERYLGMLNDPLLQQVDGMPMQEIHDALQPTFQ